MTAAQNVIDAVTSELTNVEGPLNTLLTEIGQPQPNTDALKTAADAIVASVNAVATAVNAPPVVTPPAV